MASIQANGITIEHDTFGAADCPPLLLIMGLGAQMTLWPVEFCEALADRGFHVIRFDNRDVGLSSKFEQAGIPDMATMMMAVMTGKKPEVTYSLADMADDAIGLLDALGIDRAHIVGASMGGMIAQVVAATYPKRVLSLTSIMSTTGNPAIPPAQPAAMAVLTNRPTTTDTDSLVAFTVNAARVIGSPAYPASEERLVTRVRADLARSYSPTGYMRQIAAIMASGDRRP
jgi:pimeloyl-ACP methyl ester carboxylesterase